MLPSFTKDGSKMLSPPHRLSFSRGRRRGGFLLINVNIVSEGWSLRIDFDLFEGEEGAHGGDPRLPAGNGRGQGGQAPAGQVKQGKN